jgi:sugar lactone lactonase YvrE
MATNKAIGSFMLALALFGVCRLVLACAPPDIELPAGYAAEIVLKPPLAAPLAIAINSMDEIVVTDHIGHAIYQVHEDGRITEYIAPLSTIHQGIDFDSEDNLYVSADDGLWKIAPGGVATRLAEAPLCYQLEVSPSGDIFALISYGSELYRITPDGQVSVYASGMSGINDLAINPITGDLYVADWVDQTLLKVNPDGTTTVLSSGLPEVESFIAFSSDGTLYYANIGALGVVSTTDGSITYLPWATLGQGDDCGIHHGIQAVDSQGRIVSGDYTLDHIVRFDPATETIEILVKGYVNADPLAVAPSGGGLYLGVPHPLCSGKGEVLRINTDGTFTVIVDDLPHTIKSIAFDSSDLGYAAAGDGVFTFTTQGITNTLITEPIGPQNLAVNPQDDVLWGVDSDEIWYLDSGNERVTIPYPFQQTHPDPKLAFTPDGQLYVYVCVNHDPDPAQPGIYRFNPVDSSLSLVLDMTGVEAGCIEGAITVGTDGNIYWLLSDLLQITPSGQMTLFAPDLGFDPNGLAADPNSTDLFFTSAAGVYRVFEAGKGNRYVAATGSDAGPNLCLSPDMPCQTIGHALDMANAGESVLVAQGRYIENLSISKPVTLTGGYEATSWSRDITRCETIIDGSSSQGTKSISNPVIPLSTPGQWGAPAVRFEADSDGAVLDGLTITGGASGEAGGVHAARASITIRNSVIRDNSADGSPDAVAGGGVLGALDGFSLTIVGSRIVNNQVNQGASGVRAHGGTLIMTNTIVAHNHGDAAIHTNGTVSLMNVTVARNSGGVLFNPPGEAALDVINSIIWQNQWSISEDPPATRRVTYSDIEGGWTGTGNIDAAPLFVDAVNGDYHLQVGSPCIDAGTSVGAPATDLEGTPRDAAPDMGAYECSRSRIFLPLVLK